MPDDRPTSNPSADETVNPSPRTTIVGGRPPEDGADLPPVPTGLQRLLRLASVDDAFRGELLRRRVEMAAVAGIELSASERAILAVVPDRQIATMVEHLPAPSADRRDFLRQSARAAVLLLGGAALTGAEGCRQNAPVMTTGIAPDLPPERPGHLPQPQGIRPDPVDAASPRPKHQPVPPVGIQPAPPPPKLEPSPDRPTHNETQGKGGSAPDQPLMIGGAVADAPPARAGAKEMQTTGGAAPDEPPPRPKRPNATRGIRPRKPDAGPPKPPSKTRGHSGDIPDDPF